MKRIIATDLTLLAATLMTVFLGITMIYSASSESGAWQRQSIHALLAFTITLALLYLPNKLFHTLAYPLYVFSLASLVLVLVWGTGGDTNRWLDLGGVRLQPSEFAKLATIIALARYFSSVRDQAINRAHTFLGAVALTVIPMLLIVQQPDLGTALSLGAAFFPMLYWAGMQRMLIFFITAPLLSVIFSFGPLWQIFAPYEHLVFFAFIAISSAVVHFLLGRLLITLTVLGVNLTAGLVTVYIWDHFLRAYQKARILTFIDPESDRLNAGWNIIQSKIAIGSGGLTGKGFLEGTQTKYAFLPAAHTDFIFSVFAEETGFFGVVILLSLFLFVILKGLNIAFRAADRFGFFLSLGLVSSITFYVIFNVGMTIGLFPITGIPLPLLSYGGSSLITHFFAVGLLLNVEMRRYIQ